MMSSLNKAALLSLILCASAGCARIPQGPRIRYAEASPQELQAAEEEEVVWYEFHPGDEVPLLFGLIGMGQAATDQQPLRLEVQRPFWLVSWKDGRNEVSFDGERIEADFFGKFAFLPGRGDTRGNTVLLLYIGPRDEIPEQLR